MRWLGLAIVGLVAALAAVPARAENVVRWVTSFNPSGFEPDAYDNLQTFAVQDQVFERLVCYDWDDKVEPCLAESWRQPNPRTWEFALRRGVTFHDGAPFTSEDVVFSFERARAETAVATKSLLSDVVTVEAVAPYTVRFATRQPDVLFWDKASGVKIMSKRWAEAHDAQVPAGAEDLATAYANTHADGTGPFMLEDFEPGRRIVMAKNPAWWGLAQHPHDIDRLEQVKVDTPEQGIDMLLRGEADFTQEVPAALLDRVRATTGVRVRQHEVAQVLYLGFDLASPELRSASVKGRNPFRDRRVRQAVYQAIDPDLLLASVRGLAAPAGMIVGRSAAGYDEELDRRLPYDPAKARALLVEAGYPDGFSVALDTSTYYEPALRSVAPMLGEVGIRLDLRVRPTREVDELIRTRGTDFYRWGNVEELDSSYVFRNRYDSRAPYNTGYADPEVDRLIAAIEGEVATYPRLGLIEQVWRKVLDDIVYVPLFRAVNAWAMRERLDVPMGIAPRPIFYGARVSEAAQRP